MELSVWTYEGPPHVGAIRVAASMTGVHLLLHAPQGDTYADLLFTMIERRRARPPVTYTTFQARDLGSDTAHLFKDAARDAYERFQPEAMIVGASCTAELIQDDRVLRCKYAVLSSTDLVKGTSQCWFHSYLWGRFSQPTAIAWCRDDTTRARVQNALAQAALSFLDRVLPALPAQGQVETLWQGGLRLSYRAELRAEGSSRAQQLTRANLAFYQAVPRAAAPLLEHRVEITPTPGGDRYRTEIAPLRRAISRAAWALRIAQGKLLSVARLLKALFTFDGGLDYIAWKLERHSGVPVEIPDKVRRHPLIFVWGLFWKLYRRGVFR